MKSSVALQASWDCIREIWRETEWYHFPPRKYSHTITYLPISSIVSSVLNICSGCHLKSSPLARSLFHWNVFPLEMCGRTLLTSHFLFLFQFNFLISSVKCASSECSTPLLHLQKQKDFTNETNWGLLLRASHNALPIAQLLKEYFPSLFWWHWNDCHG